MTQQKYSQQLVAVAVQYKNEYPAPKITAKGKGEIAEKMLQVAKKHKVDIKKDATLASILHALEINDYIPFEAYEAVAGILGEIYKSSRKQS